MSSSSNVHTLYKKKSRRDADNNNESGSRTKRTKQDTESDNLGRPSLKSLPTSKENKDSALAKKLLLNSPLGTELNEEEKKILLKSSKAARRKSFKRNCSGTKLNDLRSKIPRRADDPAPVNNECDIFIDLPDIDVSGNNHVKVSPSEPPVRIRRRVFDNITVTKFEENGQQSTNVSNKCKVQDKKKTGKLSTLSDSDEETDFIRILPTNNDIKNEHSIDDISVVKQISDGNNHLKSRPISPTINSSSSRPVSSFPLDPSIDLSKPPPNFENKSLPNSSHMGTNFLSRCNLSVPPPNFHSLPPPNFIPLPPPVNSTVCSVRKETGGITPYVESNKRETLKKSPKQPIKEETFADDSVINVSDSFNFSASSFEETPVKAPVKKRLSTKVISKVAKKLKPSRMSKSPSTLKAKALLNSAKAKSPRTITKTLNCKSSTKAIDPEVNSIFAWDAANVISERQGVQEWQARQVINLFDKECTLPFIARYRREHTGNLEIEKLRDIQNAYQQLKEVKEKVSKVLREEPKDLTPETKVSLLNATTVQEVKVLTTSLKVGTGKKTLADRARQLGLTEYADQLLKDVNCGHDRSFAQRLVNQKQKGIQSIEEVEMGLKHIMADVLSKDPKMITYMKTG